MLKLMPLDSVARYSLIGMVTNPNWMAPFHIARAIPTSPCSRPPWVTRPRHLDGHDTARAQRATARRGLAPYHEGIDSDETVRPRSGRGERHGMRAARGRVPAVDDPPARRGRCVQADRPNRHAVYRDGEAAAMRALRGDDGEAPTAERHRHPRARARRAADGRLVRRRARESRPRSGDDHARRPIVERVI